MKAITLILILLSTSLFAKDLHKSSIKLSKKKAFKYLSQYTKKKGRAPASYNYYSDKLLTCNSKPTTKFSRKDWQGRWGKKPGDCQDTRQKILIREYFGRGSVKYKTKKNCQAVSGQWVDQLSGNKLKNASKIHVTHLVPLRNVHESGGDKWDQEYRTLYINNLKDRHHHIVASFGENLKRRGRHPGLYAPKDYKYKCAYVGSWIEIKDKWDLCVSEEERVALKKLEDECREAYDRDHWKHWVDDDDDCMDTRQEVLIRDSDGPVMIDRKVNSAGKRKECRTHQGTWVDPYTYKDTQELSDENGNFKVSESLDVDHVVPLKNAHLSGGWSWPVWKKEEYANFLEDKNHLLAVSASENRIKGAKGPEEYMPPAENYHCDYLKIWVKIKINWKLSMNTNEADFIHNKLKSCYR